MRGSILRLLVRSTLTEIDVFRSQHSLTAHIVGVHPFPSTRNRASVENDHDVVVISVRKNLLIMAHRLLLVTAKEIHLDALHTNQIHPTHILLTLDGIAHHVDGSLLNIVPPAAGTVPKEHIHTLTLRILHQLRHLLLTDVRVPPIVNQHILEAHRLRQLDVLHLIIVVDGVVLPNNPAPCALTKLIMMRRVITSLHIVPRNRCFHDRFQRCAHRDGAPRGCTGQGKRRFHRTVAIVLLRHGKLQGVETVTLHVAEARSTIA